MRHVLSLGSALGGVHRWAGKIGFTLTGSVPRRIVIVAWMTTSTPSEATRGTG
jgi:hypothetical protein